ncbi:hypothetical protein ACTFIR_005886 [Dictyostelium discoideum]
MTILKGNPINEKIINNQYKINNLISEEQEENYNINNNNDIDNNDNNNIINTIPIIKTRCKICWIKYDNNELIKMGECNHQMCKHCSIRTFEMDIERNKEIECIWCGDKIDEPLISDLLGIDYKLYLENKKNGNNSNNNPNNNNNNNNNNNIFNSFLLNNGKSSNLINIYWECPSCQDKTLIYLNQNEENKVLCKTCNYIFCFSCDESHNNNETCEEYLKKDESSLKTFIWKQSNTKRCPNCFVFIEKRGGCSFMRCAKCKYEFCFECLSVYKKFHQCDNSEMIFKVIFMICALIGSIYIVYLLKKVNT